MRDHNLIEKHVDNDEIAADLKNKTLETANSGCLQSQLLIAMPSVDDPHFKQSVTLICQHNEEGCFGLTINRPADTNMYDVLKQLAIEEDSLLDENSIENVEKNKSSPVLRGGPVKPDHGFLIHDGDKQWENTVVISENLSVTLSKDILLDIIVGKGPDKYLFALGCASWIEGQIESEILNNSWLNCPIDHSLIFDIPFKKRWQGAADLLGVNMKTISLVSGHD